MSFGSDDLLGEWKQRGLQLEEIPSESKKERDQDESIRIVEEERDDENVADQTAHSSKRVPNQDSIIPCRESQDEEEQIGFDRNTVVFQRDEETKNLGGGLNEDIYEDEQNMPFTLTREQDHPAQGARGQELGKVSQPDMFNEDVKEEDDTLFFSRDLGDKLEDETTMNKDYQVNLNDFLNDQIDGAELVGNDDMLTGLIEEENEDE